MGSRKIWAVSDGEYSAYHVSCLFETKELAEQFKELSGCSNEVEEMLLFDTVPVPAEEIWLGCTVMENENGVLDAINSSAGKPFKTFPELYDNVALEVSYQPSFYDGRHAPRININVKGIDIDRARKVYSELKARAFAEFYQATSSHAAAAANARLSRQRVSEERPQ